MALETLAHPRQMPTISDLCVLDSPVAALASNTLSNVRAVREAKPRRGKVTLRGRLPVAKAHMAEPAACGRQGRGAVDVRVVTWRAARLARDEGVGGAFAAPSGPMTAHASELAVGRQGVVHSQSDPLGRVDQG